MTIEELKIEADKLGYNLTKKPESIKLLPCPVCGSKTTSEWSGGGKYIRRCRNWQAESDDQFCVRGSRKTCAFEGAPAETARQAKRNWNDAVVAYTNAKKEGTDV
nr:MAG TPA: restriction alleviation protein [Caudoviricetes sp.]